MTTNLKNSGSRRTQKGRAVAITVAALTAVAGLAGCANSAGEVAADEQGNRQIRIAAPAISTMNSAILYAEGNGIFEKYNIETSFIEVAGGGGLAATLGGSTDMAVTSSVNPMAALVQGQKFPIIAQVGNGFPESVIITAADWKASGLTDDSTLKEKLEFIAGKPWGVSSPQGSSSYMAKYMFQLAGLPEDSFNLNSLGSSSGTLAALKAEQVTVGSMGSPYPQVAEADGYAKMFIDVTAGEVPELQNTLTSVVAVTPDFYANNQPLIEDFRKALAEAQALVYDEPEKVDTWVYENKFAESPKDAVLAGVASQRAGGSIARTPEVDEEAAEKLVAFMKATGQDVPDNWREIIPDLQG